MRSMVMLVALMMLAGQAEAAPAKSKGAFCGVWNAVCKRVCVQRGLCGTCGSLHSGCLASGCFNFQSGARCWSNPADVALTDPKFRPTR